MQPRTYSQEGLKYLFIQVQDLLLVAQKHNGYAYGGYVRDVVTKIVCYDFTKTEVKDVDIWFLKEKDRTNFLAEVKTLMQPIHPHENSVGCDAEVYLLVDGFGDKLIYVDLVVSPTFPVTDFDVNTLVWNPLTRKIISQGSGSVTEILQNILEKKAEVENKYEKILFSSDHHSDKANAAKKRVQRRFLDKGWTLTINNKPILIDVTRDGCWVWKHVAEPAVVEKKTDYHDAKNLSKVVMNENVVSSNNMPYFIGASKQ